jgi:hypothetical protein
VKNRADSTELREELRKAPDCLPGCAKLRKKAPAKGNILWQALT